MISTATGNRGGFLPRYRVGAALAAAHPVPEERGIGTTARVAPTRKSAAMKMCIIPADICKNPLTTRKKCAILIGYKAVMKTRPGESHPERSLFGAMALCMETGGYHF